MRPEGLVVDAVKVKRMLELLAGEAGFLLDNKVQEALEHMSPEDASMAQAEGLLRALGVTDEAQLQALVNYFLKEVQRGVGWGEACFPLPTRLALSNNCRCPSLRCQPHLNKTGRRGGAIVANLTPRGCGR